MSFFEADFLSLASGDRFAPFLFGDDFFDTVF